MHPAVSGVRPSLTLQKPEQNVSVSPGQAAPPAAAARPRRRPHVSSPPNAPSKVKGAGAAPAQPAGPQRVRTRPRPLSPQPCRRPAAGWLHPKAPGVHSPHTPHAPRASPPPAPARRAVPAARDWHRVDPARPARPGPADPSLRRRGEPRALPGRPAQAPFQEQEGRSGARGARERRPRTCGAAAGRAGGEAGRRRRVRDRVQGAHGNERRPSLRAPRPAATRARAPPPPPGGPGPGPAIGTAARRPRPCLPARGPGRRPQPSRPT